MPHANNPHADLDYANVRLRLVGTRVVEPDNPIHHRVEQDTDGLLGKKARRDTPEFCKNEAATNFELFYDLWFVANLSVFSSIHEVTSEASLLSFIGYYLLLWTTWLMTTIYDVRFTADSVFERCCKAVHLGVMVGFAEIGSSFDPDNQIMSVFRAMSFFLMASRLALALQYGLVAWQIRKYIDGRRPMLLTAAIHFIAAMIYLGIAFRYSEGRNSRVYVVWYIVGLVEMVLHLSFSQLTEVLTFLGSHLGERLSLLTLIVLGEGAMILTKNVTLVVKDTYLKDASISVWSPSIIGIITSSAALIYIVFQLYFDWMHEEHSMSKRHQVWWTSLHLPFHISLVLLLEGSNQFIIWARVLESVDGAVNKLIGASSQISETPTSVEVSEAVGGVVKSFITKYQPADVLEAWMGVNQTLADIAGLPDSFWTDATDAENPADTDRWIADLDELLYTMINAIYNAFGIEAPEATEESSQDQGEHAAYVQAQATEAIGQRFALVFIYAFACAGIVLLFLAVMHVISKRKGWSPFNIIRTVICVALSIGLALTTIIAINDDAINMFMDSSWQLPCITISYFIVLVLTHLPHPPTHGLGRLRNGAYEEVEEQKGFNESHLLRNIEERSSHNHRRLQDFEDRRGAFMSTDVDTPETPGFPGYEGLDNNRSTNHSVVSEDLQDDDEFAGHNQSYGNDHSVSIRNRQEEHITNT